LEEFIMMMLWKDGRSGPAGCMAGNLVLADIERSGDKIAPRKGTTFTGRKCIYVGRVCAKDDYLQKGTRHWANISPAQHQALTLEGGRQGKDLYYLFITATHEPAAVHYWKVPGKLIGEFLSQLPVKASDESCWIRIREEDGYQYLEGGKATLRGLKVTQCHREIPLGTDEAASLQQAFETRRADEERGDVTAEQLLRLNRLVRDFGGVATVRRALDVLDNLKA
jgi:hypothetical protein